METEQKKLDCTESHILLNTSLSENRYFCVFVVSLDSSGMTTLVLMHFLMSFGLLLSKEVVSRFSLFRYVFLSKTGRFVPRRKATVSTDF